MTVPSYVQRGSDAVLRCQYDLDGQSLYSVKWYKGRHGKSTPTYFIYVNNPLRDVKSDWSFFIGLFSFFLSLAFVFTMDAHRVL